MPSNIRPTHLRQNDAVALISPASTPEKKRVSQAMQRLRILGFNPVLGQYALHQHGYLAGTDSQRRQDMKHMLMDQTIKAIFFTRGGYGLSRLLENFDLSLFKKYPKIILGYSDLTFLHLALQKIGLISFWGPMPASSTGLSPFSFLWMEKVLHQPQALGLLPPGSHVVHHGTSQGRITGGTLSLLTASLKTRYELETKNRIVFLEDVGEDPYRIDRLLTQLLAAGKLVDAAGIVLGEFRACHPSTRKKNQSFTTDEVLAERLKPLKVPIIAGFPIGHISDQVTLPYGVMAKMNTRSRTLEILEPAVK